MNASLTKTSICDSVNFDAKAPTSKQTITFNDLLPPKLNVKVRALRYLRRVIAQSHVSWGYGAWHSSSYMNQHQLENFPNLAGHSPETLVEQ